MSDPNQPPPPGGVPPGGGAVPPAQPYQPGGSGQRLEVGASVTYGWEKFQQHWQQFVLLVLGVFAATLVVSLLAFLIVLPAVAGDNPNGLLVAVLGAVAFALVFIVSMAVSAGIYRAGLGVTQGRTPSFSMFTETDNFGPFILTVLVVGLVSVVGFVLCIIPGIIWIFFTAYAPLRALDKGEGPGDAIKGSIEMVRSNISQVLLILIVAYAIYYVGSVLCYVGQLVTIPVALISICWSYRVILGEPVAP